MAMGRLSRRRRAVQRHSRKDLVVHAPPRQRVDGARQGVGLVRELDPRQPGGGRRGYDEALLLDVDGYVSEGSGENFFLVNHGKLYTPDLSSCLDGITRDTIITLAKDFGIEVIEKRITRDEVYTADEAFFTGTAAEVTPIRELDNRTIGAGRRGPVTEKLQSAFFDIVSGKNKQYAHWLTQV